MRDSDWTESTVLAAWAEEECRHLDLVASWETLLSVYETLGFSGPEGDDLRLAEFKTVITEINKFLTRMRTGLSRTTSIEDAIEFLSSQASAAEMNSIRNRQSIAYHKLKQRWIMQAITVLQAALMAAGTGQTEEGERDER